MSQPMPRALILTDGKAGHENQSRAFARALGCEFDLATVVMGKGAKFMTYWLDFCLGTLRMMPPWKGAADNAFCLDPRFEELKSRGYSVVIGTGSGTFFAAKRTARRLGVKCGIVLYPRGYDLAGFDCILAPAFDRPKKAANVIEIPANLVANDAAFYEQGVAAYRERTSVEPEIAVIVGGPNKCSTMTPEWMKAQLDAIFALPGAKAVTTSRRTPPEVEAVVDSYPWDYKLLYSKDHFNPIPAFVQLAKRLYVTAESTGMLSEACTFGTAEVVALDNLKPGPHKFRRFVEDLRRGAYVDGKCKVDLSGQFARARALLGLSTQPERKTPA